MKLTIAFAVRVPTVPVVMITKCSANSALSGKITLRPNMPAGSPAALPRLDYRLQIKPPPHIDCAASA